MQRIIVVLTLLMLTGMHGHANKWDFLTESGSGDISFGTRNAISMFNDIHGESRGIGIGGQTRVQFSDRINTEWFLDYITSTIGKKAVRNDYHVGWSLMYYLNKNSGFDKFLKPYLIAGHCFDYTEVFAKADKNYGKSRLSMATQAGIGNHFNITRQLDFSISAQYMLHFGKEIEAYDKREGNLVIEEAEYSSAIGHLLAVFSINYKFAKLW